MCLNYRIHSSLNEIYIRPCDMYSKLNCEYKSKSKFNWQTHVFSLNVNVVLRLFCARLCHVNFDKIFMRLSSNFPSVNKQNWVCNKFIITINHTHTHTSTYKYKYNQDQENQPQSFRLSLSYFFFLYHHRLVGCIFAHYYEER